MIGHTERPTRAYKYLVLPSLTFACLIVLALTASRANAFTHTIADIEDPAVSAKVLGLEVQTSRTVHTESILYSKLLSTEDWSHLLAGRVDDSLTGQQWPQVTIQRDPTVVSLAGELATDKAEGEERYEDFEYCFGGRTTTESPRLEVTLDGFYQSGTSSSSGSPAVSLATENLDPWIESCSIGAIDTSTRATRIQTVSSPDTVANDVGRWSPEEGDLSTTTDACTTEFCDFTITGHNASSAISGPGSFTGSADATFDLKIRLEYPASTPDQPVTTPIAAPETKIVKRPRKRIRTRSRKARIAIAFRSTGPRGTNFKCRLDRRRFSACSSPFKRRVGVGKHRFAVVSVYRGKADRSPAVHKWTVKKVRKKAKRARR